jgi:hypothetical protein
MLTSFVLWDKFTEHNNILIGMESVCDLNLTEKGCVQNARD